PPSASIVKMSELPGARESKAICRPSGDQRGVPVTELKWVSCLGSLPSLLHTQISKLPLRVDSKTILLPSGENCGPLSIVVEDTSLSERPDECNKLSLRRQMLIFATCRAYTNRFPRIEGSLPSWPNCNRSGSPPSREIFQSQPELANQPAF